VLTSETTRDSWLVDPRAQVLADEVKDGGRRAHQHEVARTSGAACRPRITSQMLLNKYKH
jgi:hypothetical protein